MDEEHPQPQPEIETQSIDIEEIQNPGEIVNETLDVSSRDKDRSDMLKLVSKGFLGVGLMFFVLIICVNDDAVRSFSFDMMKIWLGALIASMQSIVSHLFSDN